jgi:tyrosine-protein phosphatase SIW14
MTAAMALLLTVVPFLYYRMTYTHYKRLRVVTAGKVYRSGCNTAEGFADAVKEFGIRTIINLRDEAPDPNLPRSFFDRRTIPESQLCRELGVKFVYFELDIVADHDKVPAQRPKAIDKFLEIMDNPANYPVLFHCQAGLHRTGCLAAVYRMEYDGWPAARALRELKAHGFGEYFSTSANDFITQYVLTYQPGRRTTNLAQGEENPPHAVPLGNHGDPVGLIPPYHGEKAPPR